MSERPSTWETVIGLEVHTELATATKLFCGCPNRFGDEPNTNVCPVCLGLPGSLPVLNEQVVELAVRLGRAVGCDVRRSVFARKNYFYPDMPKDYQISQYDLPINADGELDLPSGQRVGIERAHLEEDTGKSTHVGGGGRITDAGYSLVDYNRAGVPLLEIVSRPDIRSADEARAYVTELRAILVATGASDAKMEEGSLRVDANVSVHHPGEPFGTRCEIKNLNSLRSLGRAIDYEVRRQIDLIEGGRDGPPGDPPLERGRRPHPHAARRRRRPRTTATSPSPTSCRSTPAASGSPGSTPRCRRCPPSAGAGWPRRPACRPTAPWPSRSSAGSTTLALDAIAAGAEPGRVLTHVEHNLAVEGAADLAPDRLAALVKHGDRRRAHRHPGQDRAGRDGRPRATTRRPSPRPRASRPWAPTRCRARSTPSSPATPTSGPASSTATTRPGASSPGSSSARS